MNKPGRRERIAHDPASGGSVGIGNDDADVLGRSSGGATELSQPREIRPNSVSMESSEKYVDPALGTL